MQNRAKKTNFNFIKALLSTLIVIVLIVATIAIGFFSSGFRNWNKEDWENVWNETFKVDPSSEQDGGKENAVLEESTINLNMSAASEGSVVVTATITPSTASNKKVDWSLSWNNSESEWSKDKQVSDYVTVTPNSDGSTIATVKALKAFGEQVILSCVSREDSNIKTSCTVDYSKKITSFNFGIQQDGRSAEALYWSNSGSTYDIIVDPVYSEGSIESSYNFEYTLQAMDEFVEAVQVQSSFYGPDGESFIQQNLLSKKSITLSELKLTTSYEKLTNTYFYFRNGENAVSSKAYNMAVNEFKSKVSTYSGDMFVLKVTATSELSTYSGEFMIKSSGADFTVTVEDVTLSDSSIIF